MPVPRLRQGVVLRDEGGRTAILDPRAGKRYLLDGPLHAALAAIDGARDVDALFAIGVAGAPALEHDDLEQAIMALDRLSLLEPRPIGERPLHFALGLGFSCVACGESCRRWRVGPLRPEDQANIRSVDWRAKGYAGVPEDPFVPGVDGIYLKKRADGACVFLGDDQLCNVHRVLGAERKPLVCRLFPFEPLEDEDGIRVLFRLECASLPLAVSGGGPSAGTEREMHDILSRRPYSPSGFPATPFYARSPGRPLPLAPGRSFARGEHDAIRERALAALADRARPALERFASVARGVVRAAASSEGARAAAFEEGLTASSPAGGVPDAALALTLTASLRVGLRGAGVIEAWDPDRAEPPPIPPEAQRTANDLSFETRRSRVRIAALLDALVEVLQREPRAGGAALAAVLEARAGTKPIPLPTTGAPVFRNSGARADFDAEDAHAFALAYTLLRERTILGAGDLLFGYGLLALRLAVARALAALLARLRGRDVPSAADANDAWIDVDAVLRISHTPDLAPSLERFLETESYRLFG